MKLKNLIYKTKCDNGNCKNYADFVIDRDDTPLNNQLYMCKDCLKKIYQLSKYMFENFERHDFDITDTEILTKDVESMPNSVNFCQKEICNAFASSDIPNITMCCQEKANSGIGVDFLNNDSDENIKIIDRKFVGIKKTVQITAAKKKTIKGNNAKINNKKSQNLRTTIISPITQINIPNDKIKSEKVGN